MAYDVNKLINLKQLITLGETIENKGYQTLTQVEELISAAIAENVTPHFEKVDTLPTAETAKENTFYLYMNADTGFYDIYALVGESVVRLDDTTVDLTEIENAIATINTSLESLTSTVQTNTNNITSLTETVTQNTADIATNKSAIESLSAASNEVATDEEVAEALTAVFG